VGATPCEPGTGEDWEKTLDFGSSQKVFASETTDIEEKVNNTINVNSSLVRLAHGPSSARDSAHMTGCGKL
jgi:hypothetical protein